MQGNIKYKVFKCNECGLKFKYSGDEINYCPKCGVLAEHWQDNFKKLLKLVDKDNRLGDAIKLFNKNEYIDAARKAIITLEVDLKKIGRTDKFGVRLVDDVLGFKYDNKVKKYIKEPIVRVNDLKTKNDRSEQEGIRLLVLGMFKGLRNIIMHQDFDFHAIHAFSIIVICGLVINIINHGSISKKRVCIWKKVKKPKQK